MIDLTATAAADAKAAIFLSTIKKSTDHLHVLLESNLLLSAIISPDVSIGQYYCYLILMKKILEVYERDVLPELVTISAGDTRKASQLIEEDLKNINYTLSQPIVIKDYVLTGEKMSIPFAFGFKYVMEGSKLGGKVIFKHIQRTLRLSENNGAGFIADYGVNTGLLWKQFLTAFSLYVAENDCEEEAIQGAAYAFSSIYDYFEANRVVYEI